MTQKELHKLRRQDLLQLLLAQGEEAAETERQLAEVKMQLEELQIGYERLKKRLDQKDVKIGRLQEILQKERGQRRIQLEKAGSIAEASLRLNGVFEAAQKAADQYLYNIRQMQEEQSVTVKALKGPWTVAEEPWKRGQINGDQEDGSPDSGTD